MYCPSMMPYIFCLILFHTNRLKSARFSILLRGEVAALRKLGGWQLSRLPVLPPTNVAILLTARWL